jgi:nucleoside-diphosphate-sugar epimerase
MKRVLITGAEGFTGRYVADALAGRGIEVHGIVRSSGHERRDARYVSCHAVDLRDADAVDRVVAAIAPDRVLNLAGISFPAHGDVAEIYAANLLGTRNLLSALANQKTPPQCVILVSSANVYDPTIAGRIDETAPLAPVNDYGVSKVAMEYLRGPFAARLPIVVVRPFNYSGVGQSANFVIPKLVAALRSGTNSIELGNLGVSRDWSDVRFVAECYARLLQSDNAIGQTYNICSGRSVSLRDIIRTACLISGRTLDIRFNPQFARANEIPALWGDNDRLLREIGPLEPIPIEATLRWMLEG